MTKRKQNDETTGSTFADLYDIQQELGRQDAKPQGRPRKKVQRKPTTIYLTKEENITLRRLHLAMSEHLSINFSEIVGIAIETLAELIKAHDADETLLDGARTPEDAKRRIKSTLP